MTIPHLSSCHSRSGFRHVAGISAIRVARGLIYSQLSKAHLVSVGKTMADGQKMQVSTTASRELYNISQFTKQSHLLSIWFRVSILGTMLSGKCWIVLQVNFGGLKIQMPSPNQKLDFLCLKNGVVPKSFPAKNHLPNFCAWKNAPWGRQQWGSIQTFQWSGPTEPQQGGDGYGFCGHLSIMILCVSQIKGNKQSAVHVNSQVNHIRYILYWFVWDPLPTSTYPTFWGNYLTAWGCLTQIMFNPGVWCSQTGHPITWSVTEIRMSVTTSMTAHFYCSKGPLVSY